MIDPRSMSSPGYGQKGQLMRDHADDQNEVRATNHDPSGPPGGGRLLTILEAAAALGISRSSIYRLFGAGELRWVRVCGRRRVTTAEINRFIDAHTEAAS
jgi:excisionase family DNA binding protein